MRPRQRARPAPRAPAPVPRKARGHVLDDGLGPLAQEGQNVTVVRYPAGIEDVGTGKTLEFVDGTTPLVTLYTNFLAAVLEAIQMELGPLATVGEDPNTWIAGKASLRDVLDQISQATAAGPGKLVGVLRWSRTSLAWGGVQNLSLVAGFRPAGSPTPIFSAILNQGARTLAEVLTGPTAVRGQAVWQTGTSILAQMIAAKNGAGGNPGLGGSPTFAASFTVEGVIFFMPEGAV